MASDKKMAELKIDVQGVYKNFGLPHLRSTTLKRSLTEGFKKKQPASRTVVETQHVLQDISLQVREGEFVGVVGRNGSGKSTLLKILAGIYQPSRGTITINGRIVPFIELGVGFNGELTGRENVYLNGALLGYSHKEITRCLPDILEFSELEQFIDQKLKNYSSGMQVRLAFSIATRLASSDILLIDEVLAVGDAAFQRKCFDYFRSLKKQKKTVILVTHDMSAVREYCDRAILIDDSKLIVSGSAEKVATEYSKLFQEDEAQTQIEESLRWGTNRARYVSVTLSSSTLKQTDSVLTVDCVAEASSQVQDVLYGISIMNSVGVRIFGTNTKLSRYDIADLLPGQPVSMHWQVPNIFNDGKYHVCVSLSTADGEICDNWDEVAAFRVYTDNTTSFPVNPAIPFEIR